MAIRRNIGDVFPLSTEAVFTNETKIFSGTIVNSVTGEPVPYATVSLYQSGSNIISKAANANGQFSISISANPDTLVITSAEYQPAQFQALEWQHNFELEPKPNTLPEVIVSSHNNVSPAWLLLLLPLLLKKKKAVGKVDTSTLIVVGGSILFLKGFGLFNDLLESLGLQESQDTKNLDAASTNPFSPWSPLFIKAAPVGAYILKDEVVNQMMTTLVNAFGYFNDDESAAIGVFKTLKTQSQLSYFADIWQKAGNGDLLTWLRGGAWPADRLSDAETDQINQFILKLPKYTP